MNSQNIGIIQKILEWFTKYWNDSQKIWMITKYWNHSQNVGIIHKILESFIKYWKSLGMSPKTSYLTVMHLKIFKSRFTYIFLKNTKVGDVACCRVGQLLCTINHRELLSICQKKCVSFRKKYKQEMYLGANFLMTWM